MESLSLPVLHSGFLDLDQAQLTSEKALVIRSELEELMDVSKETEEERLVDVALGVLGQHWLVELNSFLSLRGVRVDMMKVLESSIVHLRVFVKLVKITN